MQEKKEKFHAQPYVNRLGKCAIGDGFNLELHPEFIPFDALRHKVESGMLGGKELAVLLKRLGMKWSTRKAADAWEQVRKEEA